MATLNQKIAELEKEIGALKSKVTDLTENTEEKQMKPYSIIGNSKANGWYFIKGKWCTYAIYAD